MPVTKKRRPGLEQSGKKASATFCSGDPKATFFVELCLHRQYPTFPGDLNFRFLNQDERGRICFFCCTTSSSQLISRSNFVLTCVCVCACVCADDLVDIHSSQLYAKDPLRIRSTVFPPLMTHAGTHARTHTNTNRHSCAGGRHRRSDSVVQFPHVNRRRTLFLMSNFSRSFG